MRRCSSARENVMGMCSCGMYHSQSTAPFCMLLSMSDGGQCGGYEHDDMVCAFSTTSSASSSVDCTLSLGTPSTRLAGPNENTNRRSSYFGWNILPASKHAPPPAKTQHLNANGNPGGNRLPVRRCANCDTSSTPLWRNGPKGPKSLCNACGIRFKKEEKRATAAAAATNQPPARHLSHEFRFINDVIDDSDNNGGMSFRSWRFNVADRPAGIVVHDFTR